MAGQTPYAELTVDELKEELDKRDLPKSGKKDDLIARLEEDDAAHGAAAPEAAAADAGDDVPEAETDAETDAAAEAGAAGETDAPDVAADTEPDEAEQAADGEEKRPSRRERRRGAAETTTSKREPARPAPRRADGTIEVRAKAKYVRTAPRKARLVMDHIRGKNVGDARALLQHTARAAATDISKLLESAVANAENNFELDPDELRISRAFVDEGPTIKRFRPRAQGRATPIHKRTSHMTIMLTTTTKDGE